MFEHVLSVIIFLPILAGLLLLCQSGQQDGCEETRGSSSRWQPWF